MKFKFALALALAGSSIATSANAATIFSEDFTTGYGVFSKNSTGNNSINLRTGQTYVNCCGGTGSTAAVKNQFVVFGVGNVNNSGYLTTTVKTIAGVDYSLVFDTATLGSNKLVDGVQVALFNATNANVATKNKISSSTFNAHGDDDLDNTFVTQTVNFTALGGFTTIRFNDPVVSRNNVDAAIDNVTLSSAVPEPATWAMMLTGFGMIGFGLRRRNKQAARVTYA